MRPPFLRRLQRSPMVALSVVLAWAAGFGLGSAVLGRVGGAADFSHPLLVDVGGEQQTAALAAFAFVAALLASLLVGIALIDLVTLLLTRAAARSGEMAMRAAVGASPRRLLGGLLAEGSVLVLVAGAIAGAVGAVAAAALGAAWPAGAWPWREARGAPAVALCFGGFALVTVLCWLFPLRAAWRADLRRHLATGPRATPGPGDALLRNGLAVLQVGASLVLLVAAGLVLRAFAGSTADRVVGFDPAGMLTLRVELPAPAYADPAARAAAYAAMIERVSALPGVVDSSAASRGAWLGLGTKETMMSLCPEPECWEGLMVKPVSQGPALIHSVGPDYFRTIGATLLDGREFDTGDVPGRRATMVINDVFAYRFFPLGDPMGKWVWVGGFDGKPYQVVGIVKQVGAAVIGAGAGPAPTVYLSLAASPPLSVDLAVRGGGDPAALGTAVRRVVGAVSPGAITDDGMTMEQQIDILREPLTWFGMLFATLALAALLVATSSLYGVVSYGVRRRAREIGIRVAVGATERDVVRLIVGGSARVTLVGTVVGLMGALALARVLQLQVRGIDPLDPLVYAPIALLLAGVALVASYRPARRAVRLDPQLALREETA